jgi:hypothetical protein
VLLAPLILQQFLLVTVSSLVPTNPNCSECTDNLTGFASATNAVFPHTDVQNCIIHQLRNSSKYVSYGNEYLYVDEDMRLRLETKLIHSIVTGFKVLPV